MQTALMQCIPLAYPRRTKTFVSNGLSGLGIPIKASDCCQRDLFPIGFTENYGTAIKLSMYSIFLQLPKLPMNTSINNNLIVGLVGSINIEIAGKYQIKTI